MTKTKTLTAAALVGLLAGGTAAGSVMAHDGQGESMMQKDIVKVDEVVKEKHACKGHNSCKGKGADGKNSCKGKGSCRTDGGTPPAAQ